MMDCVLTSLFEPWSKAEAIDFSRLIVIPDHGSHFSSIARIALASSIAVDPKNTRIMSSKNAAFGSDSEEMANFASL